MINFNSLIDKYLKREFKPKTIGRYYPSEIGNCLRKIYLSYKYPKETKADLLKIFEAGNILHDLVVEVLRSEKTPEVELIKSELPFKRKEKDYLISGRVDDILILKVSGKTIIVEVKSTSLLRAVKKPSLHHIMQLQFYMYAIGIHNGILLYVDRRNLESKEFEIKYDEQMVDKVKDRFGLVHEALTNNNIPEPEAKTSLDIKWMCRLCDWKDECDKFT